jgi:hypothetical protein
LAENVQVYKKAEFSNVGSGISKKKSQQRQKNKQKKTRQFIEKELNKKRIECDCQGVFLKFAIFV